MMAAGLPVTGWSATTAMPSSSTNWALMLRDLSRAAAARAPTPRTSSSWPLTMITVRTGLKPLAATPSSASNRVISEPLSSIAPRPQTAPSATTPSKGGWLHWPSLPGVTGTTSWWAISRIGGRAGFEPVQV